MILKKNKYIGGYFSLELSNKRSSNSYQKFQSSRAAFLAILIHAKPKKIWMPNYICDTMIAPIKKCKIKLQFYDIDQNFEINQKIKLNKNDYIVIVNYFGIKSKYLKKNLKDLPPKQIIIDNSQAYFSKPINSIFATIYSPRKFFGLPDGGLLDYNELLSIKYNQDLDSIKRMKHLQREYNENPSKKYSYFQSAEKTLNNLEPKRMSELTKELMKRIDYENCSRARVRNFRFLEHNLRSYNHLEIDVDYKNDVPLCYPFYSENEKIRKIFKSKNIFLPNYWKESDQRLKKNWLKGKSSKILPLPVDHRYNLNDMKFVIQHIKKHCSKVDSKFLDKRIHLRPLRKMDSKKSYVWRNNKRIWRFTGSKPNKKVTYRMELEWIKKAIKEKNSKRFAICYGENKLYIGNVQFTNITKKMAEFHMFIGNTRFLGKGLSLTILLKAINILNIPIKYIYLYVHENNEPALKTYYNAGFIKVPSQKDKFFKMKFNIN